MAGLDPSQGSGLVELDDDMNGVWKITDKAAQKFKTISSKEGQGDGTQVYSLSGLTLEEQAEI